MLIFLVNLRIYIFQMYLGPLWELGGCLLPRVMIDIIPKQKSRIF